jgi:competence protein ComEA
MTVFEHIRGYVSFTKNEQKILLILALLFLAGTAIKAYKAYVAPPEQKPYEYVESDSVFAARSTTPASPATLTQRRVNINTAAAAELDALPGVGPATARQIVEYRTAHGPFKTLDDLRKIKGLGPKKLEKLQPMVTLK